MLDNHRKKILASIVVLLTVGMLAVSVPPAKAQFILAEWDYPDEYGQGVTFFNTYENSTGSWLKVGGNYDYDELSIIDWEIGVAIKLYCWANFNSTLTGASTTADGQNYLRHSVVVTNNTGTVFSQQNFTYVEVLTEGAPIWLYNYEVVLDFLPDYGQVYTVTVTYEVFW